MEQTRSTKEMQISMDPERKYLASTRMLQSAAIHSSWEDSHTYLIAYCFSCTETTDDDAMADMAVF